MSNRTYSWRGQWAAGEMYFPNDLIKRADITYLCLQKHRSLSTNEPGVDDPANNNWAHYWEETAKRQEAQLEIVEKRIIRGDPFYYKEIRGTGKPTYYVCIDEGNDNALVVHEDVLDIVDARNLTNRLNSAIYRWMFKFRGQEIA